MTEARDPTRPPETEPPHPRILLVDCDAFFVQVARLVDPEGAGATPYLLVGGRPEGRGVVTSASYEVRPFGVRSGMPTSQALRLCPDATVVPVPRGACVEKSRQVRTILHRFSPVVEAASIDEAYLDLSGTERLYEEESLERTADRIRRAVLADTDIRVSVGGGTTRLVAKLAVSRAKPNGVHVVPPGGEREFMKGFMLREIPGIGPRFQERLEERGLSSVEDVLPHDPATLRRWFGARAGTWLHDRTRGIGSSRVDDRPEARSLSRESTFPRDLEEEEEIEAALLRLAARVAADLRRKGLQARTVTVKIRDSDFRRRQSSRTLPVPVESDRAVADVAFRLLGDLRSARRVGVRLLGVALSHLADEDGAEQLSLFDGAGGAGLESERDRRLSRTVDELRERFGPAAVRRGSHLRDREG